jgi:anti-anti-sigma factor
VLELVGEIDIDEARALEEAVESAMQTDAEEVVIDLAGLDYIGSVGIGALLRLNVLSRQKGGRLSVRGARGQVARLLQLTGLGSRL